MIRGVIFDMDGVLVSTDELHYQSWTVLAEQEEIPFSREINHRQRGQGRMESLEILLERAPREYTAEEKIAMTEQKNDCFRKLLESFTADDVLPGAREMLRALRARGVRVAVGSSSKNAPVILDRAALLKEVDAVVDGNDVSRSKPAPDVFLLAAEKIGLPPEECLVLEDAPSGVEAARRAGMAVFAIGPPERHPDVEHRAEGLEGLTVDDLIGWAKT